MEDCFFSLGPSSHTVFYGNNVNFDVAAILMFNNWEVFILYLLNLLDTDALQLQCQFY